MGMDNLEREIEDAENEINRLRRENEELKDKLSETVIHLAARNSEIGQTNENVVALCADLIGSLKLDDFKKNTRAKMQIGRAHV